GHELGHLRDLDPLSIIALLEQGEAAKRKREVAEAASATTLPDLSRCDRHPEHQRPGRSLNEGFAMPYGVHYLCHKDRGDGEVTPFFRIDNLSEHEIGPLLSALEDEFFTDETGQHALETVRETDLSGAKLLRWRRQHREVEELLEVYSGTGGDYEALGFPPDDQIIFLLPVADAAEAYVELLVEHRANAASVSAGSSGDDLNEDAAAAYDTHYLCHKNPDDGELWPFVRIENLSRSELERVLPLVEDELSQYEAPEHHFEYVRERDLAFRERILSRKRFEETCAHISLASENEPCIRNKRDWFMFLDYVAGIARRYIRWIVEDRVHSESLPEPSGAGWNVETDSTRPADAGALLGRGGRAHRHTTPTSASGASSGDEVGKRLASIPQLDTESDEWVVAIKAARLERKRGATRKHAKNDGNVDYLKTARHAKDRGGIFASDKSHGIDHKGRMWRRDPEHTNAFWYYRATLQGDPVDGEDE
ncbi:MAG: hypothetical protein ABII12_13650, partial [Planctomycetota bacterium]